MCGNSSGRNISVTHVSARAEEPPSEAEQPSKASEGAEATSATLPFPFCRCRVPADWRDPRR